MDRITSSDFLRLARRVKSVEELGAGDTLREIGTIALWPAAAPPESWLLCDGGAVSRSEYADLFAVIGTAYGGGDGSTTFNLPNLKGRVAVGLNAADAEFDTLGEMGGEKAHTLSAAEMPSHGHVQNSHNHAQDAHAHTSNINHVDGTYLSNAEYINIALSGGACRNRYVSGPSVATNQEATATNQTTGGGGSHNNLPPYTVLNYIIRYQSVESAARGEKGERGDKGDAGAAGTSYRLLGEWLPNMTYVNDSNRIDCVTSGGSTYYCKASHTGHAVSEGQYWGVLAQKGDTGAAGPVGLTGLTGPQGPAGVTYRMKGEYSAFAAYGNDNAYIDCVTFDGSTYYCKVSHTGHAVSDGQYWGVLAQKGDEGTAGPVGLTGLAGPQGPAGVTYRMNGEYSASAAYGNDISLIDCVTYYGSTYYAKQDTAGNAPTDTAYWGLLAQKGADGAGDMTGPGQPVSDGDIAVFDGASGKVLKSAGKGLPAGTIADTGSAQTLSNKTLSAPVVTSPPANIARMPGEVTMWAGSNEPEGWLLCDGAAVPRIDYAALFAVIGTVYGSGDGSTTFNLPNLKGRVPVGLNGTDTAFDALGETGGEKAHALTETELPSHTHVQDSHSHTINHSHGTFTTGNASADHTHNFSGTTTGRSTDHYHMASAGAYNVGTGSGSAYKYKTDNGSTNPTYTGGESADHTHAYSGTTSGVASNHTHNVTVGALTGNSGTAAAVNQSTGGGGAHNNLQPYIVLNYVIKT